MQTNECSVCGGNNFTVSDGAFVCDECGIQSQSIREEQIMYTENVVTALYDDTIEKDHVKSAGSQLKKVSKLLSWECFNLILLGLTNEIIELGAKPCLKVTVLQLWVRYLQRIEAAFISKKFKKLPKLNTSINNIDCEILYGVENLKKKLLREKTGIKIGGKVSKHRIKRRTPLKSNNSSVSSFLTASQKQDRRNRKMRKLEKSTRDSNNDSAGFSDDVHLLQRSKKSSKVKIKLTKNIKKSLTSMPSMTKDLTVEESSKLLKSGRKCWNKLKYNEKKNLLNLRRIISIIQLALMINEDDIYLSDILRWIHEGHLHVNRVNIFLPENVFHGIDFFNLARNFSRNGMNKELTILLNHFGTSQLPNIDFKKIVLRFCDELQLPSDFTHFVCKLLLILPPRIKIFPDFEVRVMAYILFSAKFLFRLDGNAENLSSDFANKVNQSNKVDMVLFNWNDYVQYIECRNSVVAQYNYLLHKDLYGNNIRNTQLFINDWNIMKTTLPMVKRQMLSESFRSNTEDLFKSLSGVEEKRSYREIPASTKPLSSTLKWIFDYYPTQLGVETKRILKQNFIQTDILYLTDENRICHLADECNVPVQVNCDKLPLHYTNQKTESLFFKRQISHTAETKVHLINQPINMKEQTESSIDSNEETPNTIFLGTGQSYWFMHMNKSFLNNTTISKVNKHLKKVLPHSFAWFICQCSRILDCHQAKIYMELINLENEFSAFLPTYDTEISEDSSLT